MIAWFPWQQSVTSLKIITAQNQAQIQINERTVSGVLTTPDLKELALFLLAFGNKFTIKQSCFQKKFESEGHRVIMATKSRDKDPG